MKNELTCVRGDPISFAVYHTEEDKVYELKDNEFYRMKIKRNLSDEHPDFVADSQSSQFCFDHNLPVGKYYFEISVAIEDKERVILPATDTDGVRLNTLYITERL